MSAPHTAKNPRSGVALLLVMVALALMMVISIEIAFTSRVEQRIGKNARDRLQAQYLAKSAAKFAMLRLYMFREITNLKIAGTIPKEAVSDTLLEQIWSMPFPPFPFPDSKITWPGTLSMNISPEGSKIPINLLDGNIYRKSNKEMATQVREQILTLFKGFMEEDEFRDKFRDVEASDLVDSLQDWIDRDQERQKGGDESNDYDRQTPPIYPRNDRMPTLSELHMISGWSEDLVKKLSPNFSVINTSLKLNPNHVPLSRIKALWPKLTQNDLQLIQRRRLEKPFADLKELETFINEDPEVRREGRGFSFPKEYESSTSERIFYVEANAVVGDSRRTLKLGVRIEDDAPKAQPANPTTPGAPPTPPPAANPPNTNPSGPAKMAAPQVISIEEGT